MLYGAIFIFKYQRAIGININHFAGMNFAQYINFYSSALDIG
jgi:hypothetical protein